MQKSRRVRARRSVPAEREHSTLELYLHGLATIIGLGILVLPVLAILLYGLMSIYLIVAAGFLALLVGMLIYDTSVHHHLDPYSYLKKAIGKEYSFIYGFLLVVSFIIIAIAVGLASIDELVGFFGLSVYAAVALVDVFFIIMAVLLFYKAERKAMNFVGALKIFIVLLLIVVGALAVYHVGMRVYTSPNFVVTGLNYLGPAGAFSFVLLLFLWMYGGFEGIPIVYKGRDKSKVAKALVFSVMTAMFLFFIVLVLVYAVSGYISPLLLTSKISFASIFTANFLSSLVFGSTWGAALIIGLSLFVILTIAFAMMNAGDKVLHDMALDGVIPAFMVKSEGYKLLFTALIPIVVISVLGAMTSFSGFQSLLFLGTVAVSAVIYATTFFFLSLGYAIDSYRSRDAARVAFSVVTALILLALIVTFPAGFLVGLAIILMITLAGYLLIK